MSNNIGQNWRQYVQFEKVPESAATAIFYNEAGEEVERVLLEGLSRCRDVFDEEDDVDDVDDEDERGSCQRAYPGQTVTKENFLRKELFQLMDSRGVERRSKRKLEEL